MNRVNKFLSHLRQDVSANVLAMGAAAMIPLVVSVGSAVDISRYYMATARMQNACDSGALAARKSMGDDNFTDSDLVMGQRFFDQNFADGAFGMVDRARNYTADDEGVVTGTGSGNLPTTLMSMFGYDELPIDVTCSAEINISNSDIMFVLDVTGSMNCAPDDGSCINNGNNEATNAKIKGLRTAVVGFYDAVEAATSSSAQVRYGIMPYATNVNVGGLVPTEYMASHHTYQSRKPQWETNTSWEFVSYTPGDISDRRGEYRNGTNWTNTYKPTSSASACEALMPDEGEEIYIDGSLDLDDLDVISTSMDGDIRTRVMSGTGDFYRGVPTYNYRKKNKRCKVGHERYDYRATIEVTYVDQLIATKEFDGWTYQPVSYDVSSIYDGGTMTTPTGYNGANVAHSWTGCIEEATTSTDSTFNPLPSDAYDLDINLIPSSVEEYWSPQLPNAVYKRETSEGNTISELTQSGDENKPYYECPKGAQRLQSMTRDYLEDYLEEDNGFDARGSTYHDIGMLWGARFISPRGIFAADNNSAPNGDAIARHIVFMTDGELSINTEAYNAYGVEWWDRRISGGTNSGTIFNRHAARFQAACRQAREENISVWVVAFGTTLTQNLIDCATPGRAFSASDSDDLQDKFEEIAQKIAALRLTV